MISYLAPDLSQHPPRSPRLRLGGYAVFPRILDKARAHAAGKLGEYKWNNPLDQRLFTFMGVKAEDFLAAVQSGKSDSQMLAWADEHDGLIIEDDYDSELRYDRVAVGALQGLAPERVAFIGSTSTRLAPAIRLGWVLSPTWLTGPLTFEQALTGSGAPWLDQLALADLIGRGAWDRHLRRMRLVYGRRRARLLGALADVLPDATTHGIDAGLHVLVHLPPGAGEAATLSAAAAHGVAVDGLADHATRPQPPGLVLGYGNVSEPAMRRGVELLAQALS